MEVLLIVIVEFQSVDFIIQLILLFIVDMFDLLEFVVLILVFFIVLVFLVIVDVSFSNLQVVMVFLDSNFDVIMFSKVQ